MRTKKQKLNLDRETLVSLDGNVLHGVKGGEDAGYGLPKSVSFCPTQTSLPPGCLP
jgi:hypothetical protein